MSEALSRSGARVELSNLNWEGKMAVISGLPDHDPMLEVAARAFAMEAANGAAKEDRPDMDASGLCSPCEEMQERFAERRGKRTSAGLILAAVTIMVTLVLVATSALSEGVPSEQEWVSPPTEARVGELDSVAHRPAVVAPNGSDCFWGQEGDELVLQCDWDMNGVVQDDFVHAQASDWRGSPPTSWEAVGNGYEAGFFPYGSKYGVLLRAEGSKFPAFGFVPAGPLSR